MFFLFFMDFKLNIINIIFILYFINKFFFKKKFIIKIISGSIKNINYLIFKNSNKKLVNLLNEKNKIFYFGYSECPDICPKIINKISYLIKYFKNKLNFYYFSININNENNLISKKYINKTRNINFKNLQLNEYLLERFSLNYKIIYNNFNNKINKNKINHSNSINFIKWNKSFYIK